MDKEWSDLPCRGCGAHLEIEETIKILEKKNEQEHLNISKDLDKLIINTNWMNLFAKIILGTLFTYFIAVGWFIVTHHGVSEADMHELRAYIEEGNKLHYMNEHNIEHLKLEVEILKLQKAKQKQSEES